MTIVDSVRTVSTYFELLRFWLLWWLFVFVKSCFYTSMLMLFGQYFSLIFVYIFYYNQQQHYILYLLFYFMLCIIHRC